jgi:hypothetical protein
MPQSKRKPPKAKGKVLKPTKITEKTVEIAKVEQIAKI